MKYRSKCGKEIMDEAIICPNCGCSPKNNSVITSDSSNFGWSVLGFCIPLVGLILYLIWKDSTPLKAKSAGKGALVGAICIVALYIIYVITIVSTISSIL